MKGGVIAVGEDSELTTTVDGFLRGTRPLTGLELYYELERATSLLTFHTMMRTGPQNRTQNGLQQSYGDHNRLLMLALDKLIDGDLVWYRSRLDGSGDVDDAALLACFDTVAKLSLTREVLVALWLAAALHDCGRLRGTEPCVDVEDGVVLSRGIIETLCPAALRDFAYFVIHNHDYIKDLFLGEVPVRMVRDELDLLDPSLRRVASAALGMVQVAGAASLGEGRLGSFRMEIFDDCLPGRALQDRSVVTRLGRLLAPGPRAVPPDPRAAEATLASLDPEHRAAVEDFLDRVAVHGWQRTFSAANAGDRMSALLQLVELSQHSRADHVVLEHGAASDPPVRQLARSIARTKAPLTGTTVLVVEA